jgi:biopolymer transport protein TolR
MKSRRRRSVMSEINVVPYIDVMLVLLVIFMVTAPLITTGVIDLPEVSKSAPKKESIIEIKILKNESIKVRKREIGFKDISITQSQLVETVLNLATDQQTAVVISAERKIPYEIVAQTIDTLNKGGISRVGLLVRQTNN